MSASWEEALAAAEDDREHHQTQFVDKLVLQQPLDEPGAASDQDHTFHVALEPGHVLGEIAAQDRGVVPACGVQSR